MKVNIFKNLQSAKPFETTLEKIVEMIMTSDLLAQYTETARNYYSTGKKKKGDNIKRCSLPAFAPCGNLIGGKGRGCLIGLTGLCFIDIDKVTTEQVEVAMSTLREDEHVLFASRSLSGKGIHILIPYHLWKEDPLTPALVLPDKVNQIYGNVFKPVSARYRELLHLPIDQNAGNAERLCVISYDSQAYFNPHAVPLIYRYDPQLTAKSPGFTEYKDY